MRDFDNVNGYPLSWPPGWPRTPRGKIRRAPFGNHTMKRVLDEVLDELGRMGVRDWNVIVSSNIPLRRDGRPRSIQARVDDAGVAVYFRLKDEPRVLACDKWNKPEHNLWAIAKHIGAIRGVERWGVGTIAQAFDAYKALPETASGSSVLDILGLDEEPTTEEEVMAAYRKRAKECHPDRGGDAAEFAELVACKDQLLGPLGGRR